MFVRIQLCCVISILSFVIICFGTIALNGISILESIVLLYGFDDVFILAKIAQRSKMLYYHLGSKIVSKKCQNH